MARVTEALNFKSHLVVINLNFNSGFYVTSGYRGRKFLSERYLTGKSLGHLFADSGLCSKENK